MYQKFFGLKHPPFSIAPDPRYLYMSERHREALAHLLYGLKAGGGFVLLTGEIGAGKTTVCRCFLEQVPARCNVAYIFNPKLTVPELLQTVCDEFRIPLEPAPAGTTHSVKTFIDALNEFLLRTHAVGQINVLIIDEAQNLSADVLEQLRLLTNLETAERKLLQIILIGQPELRDMLARPDLEQLAQRVIARYHLEALNESETSRYVQHRLDVAGGGRAAPFDSAALKRIHQLSGGVPRRINLLCDRALLGGYASGQSRIDARVIERAATEVFGAGRSTQPRGWPARARAFGPWLGGALAATAVAGTVWWAAPTATAPPGDVASLRGAPGATAGAGARPPSTSAVRPAASGSVSMPAAAATARPASAAPRTMDAEALRRAFDGAARGEADARRELATAWQVELGEGAMGDLCNASAQQGLPCFKSASSLAVIRQLGRPGVLTLYDAAGKPYHVLLTALGPDGATLRRAGTAVTVSLASLGSAWRGEFGTFWRAPVGYAGLGSLTAPGSAGAQWLADRLARAQPSHAAANAPLSARVAAFQVAQGLAPDGVPGPMTLMLLNRATGVDEPRLPSPTF